MRTISRTSQFKRDYKRESKGQYRKLLDQELIDVLNGLAKDFPLAEKYRDHALSGPYESYRECHLKPDLLLIYGKPDSDSLVLVRLGSHSELF